MPHSPLIEHSLRPQILDENGPSRLARRGRSRMMCAITNDQGNKMTITLYGFDGSTYVRTVRMPGC
jgi:hypothetical protein